jgi:hypothetical protein
MVEVVKERLLELNRDPECSRGPRDRNAQVPPGSGIPTLRVNRPSDRRPDQETAQPSGPGTEKRPNPAPLRIDRCGADRGTSCGPHQEPDSHPFPDSGTPTAAHFEKIDRLEGNACRVAWLGQDYQGVTRPSDYGPDPIRCAGVERSNANPRANRGRHALRNSHALCQERDRKGSCRAKHIAAVGLEPTTRGL